MGVSSDAILAYGYDLGGDGDWHVEEVTGEWPELNVPWFDDGDDGTCGDCADGRCHGGDPDDCGCDRHAASVEPDDEDGEDGVEGDFAGRAMRRLLDASGFTETYEDGRPGYYSRESAAEAALGVEIETYGAGGEHGYVLAAHAITVSRGNSRTLDVAEIEAMAAALDWDGKLSAALAALGLTPTREKPSWVLCSYYGG